MIKKLYRLFSALTILALPWQTRWIFTEGRLGDIPWESATVSFYVSWIPLIVSIGLGFWILFTEGRWKMIVSNMDGWMKTHRLFLISFGLMLIPMLVLYAGIASGMWLLQTVVLLGFFGVLFVLSDLRPDVFLWFLISLIPHIFLGLVQYLYQDIDASTVMGIAAQHPWLSGPSVIEHGLYRVLRAYGGFPHPNIFGGWLAIAMTVLPFVFFRSSSSIYRIGLQLFGALACMALFATYSRSAWLSAMLGFGFSFLIIWFSNRDSVSRLRLASLIFILLASLSFCVITQWDHFITRFGSQERLEVWSLVSREKAGEEGIEAARRKPIFGWGIGSNLVGMNEVRSEDELWSVVPPEPPHSVALVAFVETGILGLVGFLGVLILFLRQTAVSYSVRIGKWMWDTVIIHPILLSLIVLSCFDHYLWTIWSGRVLLFFGVALILLSFKRERTMDS